MKNILELSQKINKTVYQIVNGKMQQTQRNNLRAEIEEKLSKDFKEVFEQTYLTKEGIVILLPNEEEGQIEITVNVKIPMVFTESKDTDTDIVEYMENLEKEFEKSKIEKVEKAKTKLQTQKENKEKASKK